MRTSRILAVSLPKKMLQAIDKKSKQFGLGRSELLRSAVYRYLRDEENEDFLREHLAQMARKMRIRTEADVEALIDSMRS